MPSNIEIKARVRDRQAFRVAAQNLAPGPSQLIHQEDVFFRCRQGRLKLRILSENSGELIHYYRPDVVDAKQSQYQIVLTDEPLTLRNLLAEALGEVIVVKKKRELWFVDETRIHLDDVEGLGVFMELEVVLQPDQPAEEGVHIATDLMDKLSIIKSDLVASAYADLLGQASE